MPAESSAGDRHLHRSRTAPRSGSRSRSLTWNGRVPSWGIVQVISRSILLMLARKKARGVHRSSSGDGPVFVDASGRRLRRAHIIGGLALGAVAVYVGLVCSAFLGGPNIVGPLLPPALRSPASANAHEPPSPAPSPAAHELRSSGQTHVSRTPQASGQVAPVVMTPAPAVPVATSVPAPTATASPSQSANAPGQLKRPPTPQHP